MLPVDSRFRGSLFSLGRPTNPILADVQDIDVRSTEPSQRSFVIFGRSRSSLTFQSPMTMGSRESWGLYAELSSPGAGGLCRDTVSRSVTIVGDIDGDGFEDLVEGYPDASRCLVRLGSGNGFRKMAVSFTIEGDGGDGLGWSVAGVVTGMGMGWMISWCVGRKALASAV